jgi:hypothetical protein
MDNSNVKPEDIVSKLEESGGTETIESALDWLEKLKEKGERAETLEELENKGILKMRTRWSNWVLILIGTIVVFDIILVWFYGSGIWSFENPNVVIAVITDNFLKIVGLGFLITREIFKKIYH